MDDEEPSWQRQLLIGLGVLVVGGLLLGVILAVAGLTFVGYAGLRGGGSSSPEPILPTTGDVTRQAPPTRTSTPPPSTPTPRRTFTLTASPAHAGSYEKVNLTGRYPGHDGTTLQVQRSLGSGPWSDFPTTTHVNGGTFATYIKTGMVGVNHFRMLDPSTGRTSTVATVTIG